MTPPSRQGQQLSPQQILNRIAYAETEAPFPWGIEDSLLIYTLFSPIRDNLGLTIEEATALFKELQMLWGKSGAAQPIVSAIAKHPLTMPIDKAIIFALGPIIGRIWDNPKVTPTSDQCVWHYWKVRVLTGMLQLVWFLRAVDELAKHQGTPRHEIKIYAQDPWFSDRDHYFLNDLGIKVLQKPEGESLTDHRMFVYAPHMLTDHAINTLTRCIRETPALYVGISLDKIIPNLLEVHAPVQKRERVEREVRQLQAYKSTRMAFDVSNMSSFLERMAHSGVQFHVRTTAPTRDELDNPCTPSCTIIPKFKVPYQVQF